MTKEPIIPNLTNYKLDSSKAWKIIKEAQKGMLARICQQTLLLFQIKNNFANDCKYILLTPAHTSMTYFNK